MKPVMLSHIYTVRCGRWTALVGTKARNGKDVVLGQHVLTLGDEVRVKRATIKTESLGRVTAHYIPVEDLRYVPRIKTKWQKARQWIEGHQMEALTYLDRKSESWTPQMTLRFKQEKYTVGKGVEPEGTHYVLKLVKGPYGRRVELAGLVIGASGGLSKRPMLESVQGFGGTKHYYYPNQPSWFTDGVLKSLSRGRARRARLAQKRAPAWAQKIVTGFEKTQAQK